MRTTSVLTACLLLLGGCVAVTREPPPRNTVVVPAPAPGTTVVVPAQ